MKKKRFISNNLDVKFKDETKVHPLLKNYFGYSFFKASARLRLLMNEGLAEFNLQTHHLGILKLLENDSLISQIQLGDELGIDKASMVKLIDQLEQLKLVVRKTDEKDRRIKNIQLTAQGAKLIKTCITVKTKAEKEFFKNLTADEIETLKRLMPLLLP